MSNGSVDTEDWESMLDSGKLDSTLEKLSVVHKPGPGEDLSEVGSLRRNQSDPSFMKGPVRILDPGFTGPVRILDRGYTGPVRILTNDSRTQYRKPEPTLKILKRPEPQTTAISEPQVSRSSVKSLEQREAEYAEARQRILGNQAASPADLKSSANTPASGGGKQKKSDSKKTVNGVDSRPPKGPDGTKGFQNRR